MKRLTAPVRKRLEKKYLRGGAAHRRAVRAGAHVGAVVAHLPRGRSGCRGRRRVVAQADRDFLRDARREDAALHPNARCYLSLTGTAPDAELNRTLRCGPIVHSGGDTAEPWDTVALRTVATAEGVRLEPDGETSTNRDRPGWTPAR